MAGKKKKNAKAKSFRVKGNERRRGVAINVPRTSKSILTYPYY